MEYGFSAQSGSIIKFDYLACNTARFFCADKIIADYLRGLRYAQRKS